MTPRSALVTQHCRERRASHPARRPLAVKSLLGPTLDTTDLHGIKESVVSALVVGDHAHIQLVMADLRVKDPKGWVEVDQLLATLRAFEHVAPRASALRRSSATSTASGPAGRSRRRRGRTCSRCRRSSTRAGRPGRRGGSCCGRPASARTAPSSPRAGLDIVAIDTHWPALHLAGEGRALDRRGRRPAPRAARRADRGRRLRRRLPGHRHRPRHAEPLQQPALPHRSRRVRSAITRRRSAARAVTPTWRATARSATRRASGSSATPTPAAPRSTRSSPAARAPRSSSASSRSASRRSR